MLVSKKKKKISLSLSKGPLLQQITNRTLHEALCYPCGYCLSLDSGDESKSCHHHVMRSWMSLLSLFFLKKIIWSFACLNSVRSVAFFIPTEFEFRLEISFALVWYCEGREFERARCLETHAPRTWPGVTGGWETRSGDTDVLSVYYF